MAPRPTTGPGEDALPLVEDRDLDPLLERIGDARVVCVGEASHGTHEFYAWRAALTRRLVDEKGFGLVAVEGDWPDCLAVHHCVTGRSPVDPRDALDGFARWPTWMWANEEVLAFTRWLREANQDRAAPDRVGFYGLDVYSLWESLAAVAGYLREHHPADLDTAVRAFRCFEPYAEDPQAYAAGTRLVPRGCEPEVVTLLGEMVGRGAGGGPPPPPRPPPPPPRTPDPEAAFEAEQNARAVVGAEAYYRAMVRGGPGSWNIRDRHMADTLDRLLVHHDRDGAAPSRAVVWEHNTHVGDARWTDMSQAGMVNVGQLVRERYGDDDCVLVGCGSHSGSVVAAPEWGRRMREMTVPPARRGSIEELLHDEVPHDGLFVFPEHLPEWAASERSHRAIGVVYHPEAERWGNYVPTVLGRRYDAFLWIDESTGLRPLHDIHAVGEEQETWPFGA